MAEFVIVTGMSGAGRTQASNTFEDLGWFVIDNLPLPLVPKVAELVLGGGSSTERVALVVGRNAPEELATGGALIRAIDDLKATGARVRVLFLDANAEILVRRYESSRRRHPLAEHESVAVGIERERAVLQTIRDRADVILDTSGTNVHELRERLVELFGSLDHDTSMAVSIVSFGFKHGLPSDVDLVFDLRFLPNPHWVPELQPMTGLDDDVRAYVLERDETQTFLQLLESLLEFLLPAYEHEGKSYLSIGIGCTGGQHRSVAVSVELADRLRKFGAAPTVRHRDLLKR